MKTPLLFIIFNRPDTTKIVWEEIRKAQPARLFIAADGPRADRPGEAEKCAAARRIVEQIDWDCQAELDFSDHNLGCKRRVSSAISWFFSRVEEGIILEDDCLPDQSFFSFCGELLAKYRDNEQIMHISGNNFLFGKIKIADDYYFSRISNIWGWATWRRAWQYYDPKMEDFPQFIAQNKIAGLFTSRFLQKRWIELLTPVYENKIDTWDYQWTYAVFKNSGLCINPRLNLVSNIGFAENATHTKRKISRFANLPAHVLGGPLKSSITPAADEKADRLILRQNYGFTLSNLLRKLISRLIKSL
jgi:hypothetical protein